VPAADPLEGCTGFDWDEATTHKNRDQHRVTPEEAEDTFFQEPLVVRNDARHSRGEKRYYALGQTSAERRLFVAFTVRRNRIRVISVRDMNRNETAIYAKHEKRDYLSSKAKTRKGDSGPLRTQRSTWIGSRGNAGSLFA
jgi:uncharacterized DUF497 family protein